MTIVLLVAAGILAVAALLVIVRMTVGPTILDRSVALDVLVTITVCGCALYAAHTRTTHVLPVLLVLSAFACVGAVSIARYASQSDDIDADGDNGSDDNSGDLSGELR